MGIPFLMDAFDQLAAGNFKAAARMYQRKLGANPNAVGSMDGLAKAYMGLGNYQDALPLLQRVHECEKAEIKDHPGQQLQMACAYWCLEDRSHALELVRGLCNGVIDQTIGMAPDQAGGATYGLILHYMAISNGDTDNYDLALRYLEKTNKKYEKRPELYDAPRQTVRQILGKANFEEAYQEAAGPLSFSDLKRSESSIKGALGVALFHDGVLRRVQDDEAGCAVRMKEVSDLGYQTDPFRWYLARHEVSGLGFR